MSKKKKNDVEVLPALPAGLREAGVSLKDQGGMNVNLADLGKLVSFRYEKALEARVKVLGAEKDQAVKDLREHGRTVRGLVGEAAEKLTGEFRLKLENLLSAEYGKRGLPSATTGISVRYYRAGGKHVGAADIVSESVRNNTRRSCEFSHPGNRKTDCMAVVVDCEVDGGFQHGNGVRDFVLPQRVYQAPIVIRRAIEKLDELEEEMMRVQQAKVRVEAALRDMGRLERQANAIAVEYSLQMSGKHGEELARALDKAVAAQGLPG